MITTDFLSTVSWKQCLNSIYSLTFWVFWLQKGKQNNLLIWDLQDYFWTPDRNISLFYNARTGLYKYLLKQDLQNTEKNEVILSGYNCVSVSNAVIQAWWNPVYTDIETTSLWLDYELLIENITEKTWVIILQHTFWMPARDTEKVAALAKEKGIILIEDVAHALWAEINWKKLWLYWDAAIFSTGRDKVISSVNWAFLLEKKWNNTSYATSSPWIVLVIKNHLYNILWYLAFKSYGLWPIWKLIMLISKKLKLFPDILSKKELNSQEKNLDYALPNSLAYLIRKELKNIEKYRKTRKRYSQIYHKANLTTLNSTHQNYFRCTYLCKDKDEYNRLYKSMKQWWVLLWNTWSEKNIAPKNTNFEKAWYEIWTCPVAEDIASRILFLPNAYNRKEVEIEKVSKLLHKFYKSNV